MSDHRKQSRIIRLRSAVRLVQNISATLRRDQVTVYAAQASFFTITAALPFLMLLLNVCQLLARDYTTQLIELIESVVPADFQAAFTTVMDQLTSSASISLLSITAAAALWSASRGIAALERGLCGVYDINISRGFLLDVVRSILYTAAFIVLIFLTLLLLVFGVQIADLVMTLLPALETLITKIMNARGLFLFLTLSVFFSLEHLVILRRAYRGKPRPIVFPGAMLSAAGWMLFSYFYSLYIRFFPRASYLYGGLALLLILMLWIYFCMIIFLCGAEINKVLYRASEDPAYLSGFFR